MNDTTIKEYGFIKYLLDNDAKIGILEYNYHDHLILATMNPSIAIVNDIAYINLRAVNYNLLNFTKREFTIDDQPILYLNYIEHGLATENYFGTIDLDTLEIQQLSKVKMMNLHTPQWNFTGLEDVRIIPWDGNIYLCGVRRDIEDTGIGRQELSKIEYINNEWTEVERDRIPASGDDTAYCEKNWMPILDKPYTWIKWCSPFEIAEYDINIKKLDVYFPGNYKQCFRGDSHVIHIDNYYYCFVHDCFTLQLNERTNARISKYWHYILRINEDLSPAGFYGPFSYDNRINIEFGCGLALKDDFCYLTYSENDTTGYIVKFNKDLIVNLPYSEYK